MSQLLQVAAKGGALDTVDGVAAPAFVYGGIPYDATGVAVDLTSPVDHWHQGLPFTENGRIAVTQTQPSGIGNGGAPYFNGRLSMDVLVTNNISAGVPYTATGGIAVEGLAPFLGVTITDQPDNAVVTEPDGAVFSITATSGDLSPIIYQWQLFSGTWNNIPEAAPYSGTQTDTLTINPTELALDGGLYRCRTNNDQPGFTDSNSALLTVLALETFNVLSFNGLDNVLTFDGVDNVLTFDGTP